MIGEFLGQLGSNWGEDLDEELLIEAMTDI